MLEKLLVLPYVRLWWSPDSASKNNNTIRSPVLAAVSSSAMMMMMMIVTSVLLYTRTASAFASIHRSSTRSRQRLSSRAWTQSIRGGGSSTTTARSVATTNESSMRSGSSSSTPANDDHDDETKALYTELVERLEERTQLERVAGVLSYDQMVFMPAAASSERGKQSAALAAVLHEKSVHPRIGELLDRLEQEAATTNQNFTPDQHRTIVLARRAYSQKIRIPTALAARHAAISAQSYTVWTQARQESNYTLFADLFRQGIAVAQETASYMQQTDADDECAAEKSSLYATLVDTFECGMAVERIDAIFGEIQAALVPLIARVLLLGDTATPPDTSPLSAPSGSSSLDVFPIEQQAELSRQLVSAIGFDTHRGRIDVSVHPFSSGLSTQDVRITSRFTPEEWYQGLAGSLHEAGHALYEQHMGPTTTTTTNPHPKEDDDTTSGSSSTPLLQSALSMGMHESQSLFWERHVGLSRSFWEYATPIVHQHLPQLAAYNSTQLYAAVNAAQRSLIRVEADELTYPLHVILRYQLERDLIEGRLQVEDVPTQWNKGMHDMLGIEVPNDAQGCLQDVHWSMLAYGYFPTYLLGAAAAAQLAHYCQQDIPDFDDQMAAGDFTAIRAWMTDKVHRHGSRYQSLDAHLLAQVGERLNPQYLIDYLTAKYTELYKC